MTRFDARPRRLPTSGLISILDRRLAPSHDGEPPIVAVYEVASYALGRSANTPDLIDAELKPTIRAFAESYCPRLARFCDDIRHMQTDAWLIAVAAHIATHPYTEAAP